MLTKGVEVIKYVKASAGRTGIGIVFEDTNQPRHDGNTIYLPKITIDTTEADLKMLMSSVDHEVAHDLFSDFELLKEKRPQGIEMLVWNILEDSRVNAIEAKEYKGFRENWDDTAPILVEAILKRENKKTSRDISSDLITALIHWDSSVSAEYFPMLQATCEKYPVTNKLIEAILETFSPRLRECHNTLDKKLGSGGTYKLAKDILKEVGISCKEEIDKEMKKNEEKGRGTPTDKKSIGDPKEGPGEASEEAGDGPAKPEEDKKSDEDYKVITIPVTKEDLQNFTLTQPKGGREMSKVGVNFDYKDKDRTSQWDISPEVVVVDYPNNCGETIYLRGEESRIKIFLHSYNTGIKGKIVEQENFAQQVRRLIQIRAKSQTQYGVKKGKLDQARLARVCFNAPGLNERIFKNKINNNTLDTAISILVDMSGSMGGHKAFYALAATLLLKEVCSTINIPLEVVGFTDGATGNRGLLAPLMFIYKGFNDLRVSDKDLKEYFATSSYHMCGNPDGESILWAHSRLIKRREKRKVLIVMSDGCPAASKSSVGLEEFTKVVIKEIEDSKKVDIYGLGLLCASVEDYYTHHSTVWNVSNIPSTLLSLIERKVLSNV